MRTDPSTPTTVDPPGPVQDPSRALIEVSATFARGFLRRLEGGSCDGLSYPGLRVLEQLHCQGPAKMGDLAEAVELSARNMTVLADALEADGLLRRVPHPSDRRATLLELTCDGAVAAEQSLAPRLAEIGTVFDALTNGERERFVAMLRKLVFAMKPCPGEAPEA